MSLRWAAGIAAIVTVWVGVVVAAGREITAIALHPPHSVIPGKKVRGHRHPPMSRRVARLVVTGGGLPKARHMTVDYLSNARQTLVKIAN